MKRNLKWILFYSIFAIVLLIVGLIIYFTMDNYLFISISFISFPFALITYLSMLYLYKAFEDASKAKKAMIISLLIRAISGILAIGLSLLLLILTNSNKMPEILYIFVSPTIILVGYLSGMFLR